MLAKGLGAEVQEERPSARKAQQEQGTCSPGSPVRRAHDCPLIRRGAPDPATFERCWDQSGLKYGPAHT